MPNLLLSPSFPTYLKWIHLLPPQQFYLFSLFLSNVAWENTSFPGTKGPNGPKSSEQRGKKIYGDLSE